MKIVLFTYPEKAMLSLPDSAVVKNGNPFFIPDFDSRFEAKPYIAVKISRLGKSIAARFAHRYYEELAPAFNISAADLLIKLRRGQLPWTEATGFDKSVPLGKFLPSDEIRKMELKLTLTDKEGNSRDASFPIPSDEEIAEAIERVSLTNSLKMGDLLLLPLSPIASTSSLSPVIQLENNTLLTIKADDRILLDLPVR